MRILVNGDPAEHVAAIDRGLQFGDGLFETLCLRNGFPQLWDRHWERLCRGTERLRLPRVSEKACLEDLQKVAMAPVCMAKLIVTRGPGPRGYAIPARVQPTRVVLGGERMEDAGTCVMRVGVCRTRVGASPVPGCKHLNRLENVLARMEWAANWDEGLMLDGRGKVVGGTQSNLFIVENRSLVTPPLRSVGIPGTRRGWLLEQGKAAGLQIREEPLSLARVRGADALFLSNTRIGLRPAAWIGENDRDRPRRESAGVLETLTDLGAALHALG